MATNKPCFSSTRGLNADGTVPECVEGTIETKFWYANSETGCLEQGTEVAEISQDAKGNCVRETTWLDKNGTPFPEKPTYQQPQYVIAATCSAEEEEPPPEPITLDGEDCEGNAVPVTGEAGQLAHVIQAPGTVFKVQLCDNAKDFEKVVLCDKVTEHKVAVITDFTNPAEPVVTYWDINLGAPWTGDPSDLETCADSDTESDAVEMCDQGTNFLRWVVKKNGEPTGIVFDTDIAGQPYTVVNEGSVQLGKCETSCAKAPQGVVTSWAV